MATLVGGAGAPPPFGGALAAPGAVSLSAAQTGNGQSTNVVDRGGSTGAALLKITTTVGATPTVTIAVEGSADGTNWFSVPYSLPATPTTVAVSNVVITTATTNYYYLQADFPWRFLRLTFSANTNVTVTADAWVF
jgi:hypothetical protein